MMTKVLARLKRNIGNITTSRRILRLLAERRDFEFQNAVKQRQLTHPNPLTRFGKKCYSQCDEDGITLEIVRRLGIEGGTFCEYGVGDGTENNTLVLAALGWRGFWAGGEALAFGWSHSTRFRFYREWITAENIVALHRRGVQETGGGEAGVLSLDLDGNDIYLVEKLLDDGVKPGLFIVEINSRFPPPVRFQIAYDPAHQWQGDDYYGASLQSYADLFARHGYTCICCNAGSGTNAFFVRNEDRAKFPEVPEGLHLIHAEPHHYLTRRIGHPVSLRTIERLLAD